MLKLLILSYLILLSSSADFDPCETFKAGLLKTFNATQREPGSMNVTTSCSFFHEIQDFYLNHHDTKNFTRQAQGFKIFCGEVFENSKNIFNFELEHGEISFDEFYQAIELKNFEALGYQTGLLIYNISGDWTTVVSGFYYFGGSSKVLTYRKPLPLTYIPNWKNELFIFGDQDNYGLWRSKGFNDNWPAKIKETKQPVWGLLGNSLVLLNKEKFTIEIYEKAIRVDDDTEPTSIQKVQAKLSHIWPYTTIQKYQKKASQFILGYSDEANAVYIYDVKKFPSNFNPLEIKVLENIVSYLTVKYDDFSVNPPLQHYYLILANRKGGVQLVNYTSELDSSSTEILRYEKRNEKTPENNLFLVRRKFGSLLFLNTGEDVFQCNLTTKFKDLETPIWTNIGLPKDTTVSSMVFGVDPDSDHDILYIATTQKSQVVIESFDLEEQKLLKNPRFDPIDTDQDVQTFDLYHEINMTRLTKEGSPSFYLAAYESHWLSSNQLNFYRSRWDSKKKKHVWIPLGTTWEARKNLKAVDGFTFPFGDFSSQNPNSQKEVFHTGLSWSNQFVERRNDKIRLLQSKPSYGNETFVKLVTNSDPNNWYLRGGLQYPYLCFASIASTVYNFYKAADKTKPQLTQCEVINLNSGLRTCCDLPQPEYCQNQGGTAHKFLEKYFDFESTYYKEKDFSFERIKLEINNNHLITTSRDPEHVMVIFGYAIDPNPNGRSIDRIVFWNPTSSQRYHGLRMLNFDEFYFDKKKGSIAIIRDSGNY